MKKNNIFILFVLIVSILLYFTYNKENKISKSKNINIMKDKPDIEDKTTFNQLKTKELNITKENNKIKKTKSTELLLKFKKNTKKEDKAKVIFQLSKIDLIGHQKEIFNLIENEQDSDLKNELIYLFFDLFKKKTNSDKPLSSEDEIEIIELANSLITNEKTRKEAIKHSGKMLNSNELKDIYLNLENDLSNVDKKSLLNIYTNTLLLSKKNPLNSDLKDEINNYISSEDIKNRLEYFLNDSDFLIKDEEERKKFINHMKNNDIAQNILIENIDYSNLEEAFIKLKAKYHILDEDMKISFIEREFLKMTDEQQSEFIIFSPKLFIRLPRNIKQNYLVKQQQKINEALENRNKENLLKNNKLLQLVKSLNILIKLNDNLTIYIIKSTLEDFNNFIKN